MLPVWIRGRPMTRRWAPVLAGILFFWVAGCERDSARPSAGKTPPPFSKPEQLVVVRTRPVMGTFVTIQVAGSSRPELESACEEAFREVERLEALAHPGREGSVVRQINEAAGKHPVAVPGEVFQLLSLARSVSERSGGAFDITVAAVSRLWDFRDPGGPLPGGEALARALPLVDWRSLVLDEANRTAFLRRDRMEIGLGAVAKGFAADAAVAVLRRHDISGALVDAGGDMALAGSKNGSPWTVGIQHPRKPRGELVARLEIREDLAVVTSGDYERGFVREGIRYHHILDPRTGEPARLCQSVTVAGPSCGLADALATAVFVLGPEQGLAMLGKDYPEYDAFVLDADGREHKTAGWNNRPGLVQTPE